MKIVNVAGARPNFVKMAPIMAAMARYPERIRSVLVHTGQHYDQVMSEVFFDQLELARPALHLGIGEGSPAEQTGRIMLAFDKFCRDERPDLVLVVGDVTSTLACALAARQCGIPVAHVEAGLRSFDETMPEELNRRCTDQLSDYLFTTEPAAGENLLREGIGADRIHFVGNVMIDTLFRLRQRAAELPLLREMGLTAHHYGVLTLHRPANVDSAEQLARLLEKLAVVARRVPLVFPVHPRTMKAIARAGLGSLLSSTGSPSGIWPLAPQGYLEFLHLMMHARLVLTDSGGIQEETTALRIPCLTLRDNTERPVTCQVGSNILVGSRGGRLIEEADAILAGRSVASRIPEKWDGRAAERIVEVLLG